MTPMLILQAATTQALPEQAPAQTVEIADQAGQAVLEVGRQPQGRAGPGAHGV